MLGGTVEGRQVAELLAERPGCEVVMSLAGHTVHPVAMPCAVRTGGFGGVSGLADHLRTTRTDAVIDATHPFSMRMAANAVDAAERVGVATVRLVRPPWSPRAGHGWIDVADLAEAGRLLSALGARRVLLTTGRLDLEPFASVTGVHFIVRSIGSLAADGLPGATVIQERGPFTEEAELALLLEHDVDTLVTKNSGGSDAKLVAARQAGVQVVMVRRLSPAKGASVPTARDAVAWLDGLGYHSSPTST